MKVLRTPDERFEDLPDWPFAPHWVEVPDGEGGRLRMHYVDEGPAGAAPVLCLHGEPTWSYLYRKMVPPLVAAGHRVVSPDLVGFGRSDKPAERSDYSYQRHVDWLRSFVEALDLRRITLVCQDWGGLLGLRLVAHEVERSETGLRARVERSETDPRARVERSETGPRARGEHGEPGRFARVVAANTFLPTGDAPPSEAFLRWREFSQRVPELPIGLILQSATATELPPEVLDAYEAPFPDESYKAGARAFPMLVPIAPDDPAAPANRRAWQALERFDRPFLTAFSDGDPITHGGDAVFQARVPGARGLRHVTIAGGGHFLQEDRGEELARVVAELVAATPEPA